MPNISGSVSLTYTCVQGGLPGTGNISSNPLFVHNPPQGFFFLSQIAAGQTQDSPCVDAGDPTSSMISGTTRTDLAEDTGVVDMGFHWSLPADLTDQLRRELEREFESEDFSGSETTPERMDFEICNYPNPFNPTTTITLNIHQFSPVEITVMDVGGRIVSNLFRGSIEAGKHEFVLSGAALSSGVYIYRADVAGKIVTGKALLIK